MFGVMTARLDVMMLGVAGVTMRGVGVVRRLFMIAGFVMLGGFAVMLRSMLVVFGGLIVMLDVGVLAHMALRGLSLEVGMVYAGSLTLR
jgi:hypothetical protein